MTFLRPWLLLLILLPIVFRLFRERVLASSDWHKVIDERLLPYLLIPGTSATAGRRSFYKIILWTLLSIGAAGPAWDKMPVPSRTAQPGTIIVLELSPAMSGQNLAQAQRKILDILNELKGEQVGLVLYDRFGYTAGPLTFETDIIRDMVPYLNLSLLPEAQFNPVVGFEQADKLLGNAGIRVGRILFLTSGAFIPENMPEIVKKYDHEIGVLGIGPKEAHPIPLAEGGFLTDEQNRPVMVQLRPEILSKIGVYQPMTSDDTDIKRLLYKTEPTQIDNSHDVIDGVSLWQDRGAWFVLACLPLFALLFRKGIIMLLVLGFCLSAEASLWRRPDQEEYLRQIDAVRDYRRARYRIAGNTFKTGSHTDDWYNWGNALAFQKRIQEAIDAYKKVLEKDPKHEDARYNKEYLEEQLKKLEEEKKKQEEEEKQKEEEQKQEEQKQEEQPPEPEQQEKQPPEPEQQEEQPPEEQEKQKQEEEKKIEQLNDMLEQEKKLQEEQKKELEKQQEPEKQEELPKPEKQEQQPEPEQQEPEKQDEQKPEEQEQQPEPEEQQPEKQDEQKPEKQEQQPEPEQQEPEKQDEQKPKEQEQQKPEPEKADKQQREEKKPEMSREEQKKAEALERLKKQIQKEQEKKTKMQQQLQKIKDMSKEEKQKNLKNISQEITKELHRKEKLAKELEKKNFKRMNELMKKENELKKQELELLDDMTKPEKKAEEEPPQNQENAEQKKEDKKQDNNKPEKQDQQKQDNKETEKQEEQKPEEPKPENPQNEAVEPPQESVIESDTQTDPFDEKAKKILNRLENDEGNVLRYRIRQQYIRRVGE